MGCWACPAARLAVGDLLVCFASSCPVLLQAGKWSQEGHWCYPPAFRAAVRELLRITHKHGGVRRRDGQQLWGLNTRELQDLLLPVMGRGSMTAWVKP